jgi:acyl carrier protein
MKDKVRDELKILIQEVMGIDIDQIDNNKNLATVDEWDSFNNLMLISKVEDHFKIKFSVKDIQDVDTIHKVIEVTRKKIGK